MLLFIISSIVPMVFGYDDIETLDRELMNDIVFACSDIYGSNKASYYREHLLKERSDDVEPEEVMMPVESPPTTVSSTGPMDSPWPMKCHDTHHTGLSPYSTANNPGTEKWRFNCGRFGMIDGGAILGGDGTIYFGDFDGYLYAMHPNGTLKWKHEDIEWISSIPAIDEDGTIYIGTWSNYLYAINSDGTNKWRFHPNANIDSSPAIAEDGTIYFGTMWSLGSGGKIHAVNPDGSEKWHYKTNGAITSSPAIGNDGTIYIGSSDSYLYAMNPNGTLKWRFKTGDEIHGDPSIAEDGTIYIGSYDCYIYALYPNGTMKWKYDAKWGTSGNPSIGEDGTIYVGTNKLHAINPDGTLKWSYNLGGGRAIDFSSPAISDDGTIYIGTTIGYVSGGEILAVNSDGTERWRKQISNDYGIYSSPCIGEDGTVYIGSRMHYEFEPEKWTSWGFLHAFGTVESNTPPDTPTITGSLNGEVREAYVYWISTTDSELNPISFYIDWGDGTDSDWIGQYASGERIWKKNSWLSQGNYTIRVKAKDEFGGESNWATLEVSMPKNKSYINTPFLQFLENHPNLFPLLRKIFD